jgi:undecaprenol kinase
LSAWKNRPFAARLRYALHGLVHALCSEQSLKLQLLALLAALGALVLLRPAPIWWAAVLLAAAGVLATELLNTAIEHLADALHPAESAAIRTVKDCAAAAVLIASLGALAVAAALLVHFLKTAR